MKNRSIESLLKQKKPVLVEPDVTVHEVAQWLTEAGEGAALVVENDKAIGILTLADIVERVVARGRNPSETLAVQVMTKNPVVIRSSCSIGNALYLMHEYGVHYVPVVDQCNCALGVVREADALASDLAEYAHDVEMLDHIAEII